MGNRAEKKRLKLEASGVGHPDEKHPDQQMTGLLDKLRESRERYVADDNPEMIAYVDEIINRITLIRRTERRAKAHRLQKRRSAKAARRTTRRTRK